MLKKPELDNVAELLPLSPTQGGILYECLAKDGDAYHAVLTCTITGPLDTAQFRSAFEAELAAHPMCRACFVWEGVKQPIQVIRETVDLNWQNLSGAPEPHIEAARNDRFDLKEAPLMSVRLVSKNADEHVLIWSCHHIISDAWSSEVMLDNILLRMAGKIPDDPVPFSRHLRWLASRDAQAEHSFWQNALSGIEDSVELPIHQDDAQSGHAHITQTLPEKLSADCREAAQKAQVTSATFYQTAWAIALSRMTRQTDIVMGETHAGRPLDVAGIERVVGPFVTTVPARFQLSNSAKLSDILATAESDLRARQSNCHIGLSGALKAANLGQQSLFDTLFVAQSAPSLPVRAGLSISNFTGEHQTSFPLALMVTPSAEATQIELTINSAAIPKQTAVDILGTYKDTLQGMAERPSATLATLLPPERPKIPKGPDFQPVTLAIQQSAQTSPQADALVTVPSRLSYSALHQRACGLAAALQEHGIGKGDIVPVATGRGAEAIVGMLGALYAGAAYTPIDLNYPSSRNQAIIDDLQPKLMLSDGSTDFDLPAININDAQPSEASPVTVSADDLAYVIFTSGSTGRPKGVRITHGNLAWSTNTRNGVYGAGPKAFLHLSSFAFDSSIVGIYWTLTGGGKLVIPPSRAEQDMPKLLETARAEGTTHLLCLPSLYDQMLSVAKGNLPPFDTVIAAGETLTSDILERHREHAGEARLFNEYGPTEASVWCAAYDTRHHTSGPVPIGKAPKGASLDVCDQFGKALPTGIEGEIVVSGEGISPGYLNRPEETSDAFISTDGLNRYKTGDRGYKRPDGQIVCLGRLDRQVKIRGHRVEPDEIANLLRQQEGGDASVVVAPDAPIRLLAAVESARSEKDIRTELAQKLPDYMVPSKLLCMNPLPRLPNGKLDTRTIGKRIAKTEAAEASTGSADRAAPSSYYQDHLARIWEGVLKQPITPETHFFDAGGDSLQSISVIAGAESAGLNLLPSDLFDYPVLKDLAGMMAERAAKPLDLPDHYRMVATTNTSGTQTPFFMIHGSPEMYAGLAKTLGPDRPIAFAFSAYRGGLLKLGQSIEDMAAESVAALRAWKPDGPYAIGGYSIGGTIAIEIAHQLSSDGAEVENVILLDPSPYTPPPQDAHDPALARIMRGLESTGRIGTSLAALARYRATSGEKHRFRYLNQAYRISLYRYRPPVYRGIAKLFYSAETPGSSRGIEQALPNRTTETLHHKHLEFQKDPEAIADWTGRIYEVLNEHDGD